MRVTPKAVAAIACLCLVSCWAPEEFTATLSVDKSRHFQFTYDGTVVFGPALGEIKQHGQLSQAAEAEMKKGEEKLRKERGFSSVTYVGRGRYKVRFQETGAIESGKKIFLDLVEFRVEPGGRIRVLGAEFNAENRRELSGVLKLDGTLKVTTELKVVEHNATSTPWFGGRIGAYEWHVTLQQVQRPTIVLQP